MSVLHELTNEQIAAFKDCKTREEMIAKANELGITMLFTGMRHFKH